jgi:hypothetical protein
VVVAQKEGAVTAGVVDVFVAVEVPFASAIGMGDVDAVWLDIPGVVGDAGGEYIPCSTGSLERRGGFSTIGCDQGRVV